MFRDVATIIADKCINPNTGIPHLVSVPFGGLLPPLAQVEHASPVCRFL